MKLESYLEKLKSKGHEIKFEDTMAIIDGLYDFKESAFNNGDVSNTAGENSGSCKIFRFAQLNNLNQDETLKCFGQYFQDVLNTPNDQTHQNIRQFILNGWDGISFDADPLKKNNKLGKFRNSSIVI